MMQPKKREGDDDSGIKETERLSRESDVPTLEFAEILNEPCIMIGGSVIGPRHVRERIPNQDAYALQEAITPDDPAVAAVADGHGGEKYTRSDRGSKLATRLAVNTLEVFLKFHKGKNAKDLEKVLKEAFVPHFIKAWKDTVRMDLKKYPLNAAEKGKLGRADEIVLYGTTVLMAASLPDFDVFLQLGDGDIVQVVEGELPEIIFPRALREEYETEWTDSLFSEGAEKVFGVLVAPRKKGKRSLNMLYTDGFYNGFPDPVDGPESEAAKYFAQLGREEGPLIVQTLIDGRLERVAEVSRDDTTVVMMWREGAKS